MAAWPPGIDTACVMPLTNAIAATSNGVVAKPNADDEGHAGEIRDHRRLPRTMAIGEPTAERRQQDQRDREQRQRHADERGARAQVLEQARPQRLERAEDELATHAPSISAACTLRRRATGAPRRGSDAGLAWRLRDASDERAHTANTARRAMNGARIPSHFEQERRQRRSGDEAADGDGAHAAECFGRSRRVVIHHDPAGSRSVQPFAGPGQQSRADEAPDADASAKPIMPRPAHNSPARSKKRVCPRSAKRENAICMTTLPTNVAAAITPRLHPGSEYWSCRSGQQREDRARCHREHRLAEVEKASSSTVARRRVRRYATCGNR